MSQSNKKQSNSEDVIASLMDELKLVDEDLTSAGTSIDSENSDDQAISLDEFEDRTDFGLLDLNFGMPDTKSQAVSVAQPTATENLIEDNLFEIKLEDIPAEVESAPVLKVSNEEVISIELSSEVEKPVDNSEKTVALSVVPSTDSEYTEGERTVAVAGYSNRSHRHQEDNVKISVGQSGSSSAGYGGWGSTDSNLAQAENLKIAQNKILELEKENEKLRHQNDELVSASEIIRERADLLTAQVYEYKNDREALESSFKSEMALLKSQVNRKDAELQKAQMKIDDLDSRLKFDMKKIRVRERELENRLELIRAEKNALVRSKDEQILESRRKIDQLQLEVDSFRQKCVDLNRVIETNQDSFKRTTRALRLAMANLELQEENKTPLKKVD